MASVVTYTHATATITTTSSEALAVSSNRKYALLINDSDTPIYLNVGATAVANQGIRLNANGGAFELGPQFGNLAQLAINAIHAGTGNKTLLVTSAV